MKIRKAFANGSPTDIKFSKTQLSKVLESGGFAIFDSMNPFKIADNIVNKAEHLSEIIT